MSAPNPTDPRPLPSNVARQHWRNTVSLTFVTGSGKNRRTATVPHWMAIPKGGHEKVREDAKAIVTRPETFRNHSGVFEELVSS